MRCSVRTEHYYQQLVFSLRSCSANFPSPHRHRFAPGNPRTMKSWGRAFFSPASTPFSVVPLVRIVKCIIIVRTPFRMLSTPEQRNSLLARNRQSRMGRNGWSNSRVNTAQQRHQRSFTRCSINTAWLKSVPVDTVPQKNWNSARTKARPTIHLKVVPRVDRMEMDVQPPVAFKFLAAAYSIPHPAKAHKGGEDAYFLAANSKIIGIADGVGGWEAHGIDSGLYSRSLMQFASEAAQEITNPLTIMKTAHARAAAIPGSSTCCIISLNGTDLEAANLGDSGFLLIRDGAMIFRTREQQHYFNCPLQIGSSRDTPDDADQVKLPLQLGDVLVIATDGLFDNVSAERIVELTVQGKDMPPEELVRVIAEEASRAANDPNAETPFAEGAQKAGQSWQGGKLDDITVIIARVALDEH